MDPKRLEEYHQSRPFTDKAFRSSCYAPHVSMYFDTLGNVIACCQNLKYIIGNVAEESLRDIWTGPKAQKLRRALEKDRFGAGCQFCEWQISVGNYVNAFTRNFDMFPVTERDPEWPVMMEYTVSNTCNLECIMCYGLLSSSIRSRREGLPPLPKPYGDKFFNELRPFLHHLEFAKFLGGEPFLAAESFRIWDTMHEEGVSFRCNVTTNGTQWNERVEKVLERHPISICISMDASTQATMESIRVNAKWDTVQENFRRFHRYTRERGTDLTLTFCLMRQNWREFGDYLRFADEWDCPVCVNLVREPPHCSLWTLPIDELADIADALEKQGETLVDQLGKNRSVWIDQVTAIRRRVENEGESTRSPFVTPLALVVIDKAAVEPRPDRVDVDKAKEKLAPMLEPGTSATVFQADQDDFIQSIESPDGTFFGLPVSEVTGKPFPESARLLADAIGPYRTIPIERTGEQIDRMLAFHRNESQSLEVIRFISIPRLNEFHLPAGSMTAAARTIVRPQTLSVHDDEARHIQKSWDESGQRAAMLLDPAGRIESIDAGDHDLFGLCDKPLVGMNEAEFDRAMVETWGPVQPVHHDIRVGFEMRTTVHTRASDLLMLRSVIIPRFDGGDRHVGYARYVNLAQVDADRGRRAQAHAERMLKEWSGRSQLFRFTHTRIDEVTKFDGPAEILGGIAPDSLLGKQGWDIHQAIEQRFGAGKVLRWELNPDGLDTLTEHHSDEHGYWMFRIVAAPNFNAAGHYLGPIRWIASWTADPQKAVPTSGDPTLLLQQWAPESPILCFRVDEEYNIVDVQGDADELLGVPLTQLKNRPLSDLETLAFDGLGEREYRWWNEKAGWLDIIAEYRKPGRMSIVRSITVPASVEGGAAHQKSVYVTGITIEPEDYQKLQARAVARAEEWAPGSEPLGIFEDYEGAIQFAVGGPQLGIQPEDFRQKDPAQMHADFTRQWGEGRYLHWESKAGWLDEGHEFHSTEGLARRLTITTPYVPDGVSMPGRVRWLAARTTTWKDIGQQTESAKETLREWAQDGAILELSEDRDGKIVAIRSDIDPWCGIAVDSLRGQNMVAIQTALEPSHGPAEIIDHSETDGVADVTAEFRTHEERLQVRGIRIPRSDGVTEAGVLSLVAYRVLAIDADDTGKPIDPDAIRSELNAWVPGTEAIEFRFDLLGRLIDTTRPWPKSIKIHRETLLGRTAEELWAKIESELGPTSILEQYRRDGIHRQLRRIEGGSGDLFVRSAAYAAQTSDHRVRTVLDCRFQFVLSHIAEADIIKMLSEWSGEPAILRMVEDAEGVCLHARADGGQWHGLDVEWFADKSPTELLEHFAREWGESQLTHHQDHGSYQESFVEFHRGDRLHQLRILVTADPQTPGQHRRYVAVRANAEDAASRNGDSTHPAARQVSHQ